MARLIAVLACLATLGRTVMAQTLTVTTVPDSAVMGAGDTATALVIVRNTGDKPVYGLRLSWLPNNSIHGQFDAATARIILGGGSFTTTLHVTRTGTPVRVEGLIRADAEPTGTVVAPFRASAGAYTSPDEVADVQLAGVASSVTSRDHDVFYVVIRNKTDSVIRAGPITVDASKNFRAGVDDSTRVARVPAHSAASVAMYITGDEKPTPGNYTLVVNVPLHWTIDRDTMPGCVVVATAPVAVGVWGESDILKAIGVPSFLVLPGFLMLVTFGQLWKLHKPWGKAGDFPVSDLSPPFWLLGITLSGLFAVIAPHVGLGDYLERYDITDIAAVWLGSIAVGAGAYGILWYLGSLSDQRDGEYQQLITPRTTDGPTQLLKRLAAAQRHVPDTVRLYGEKNFRVFEVRRDPSDPNKIWIAPQVLVHWTRVLAGDGAKDQERLDQLITQTNAAALAEYLAKYEGDCLTVRWSASGTITGLTSVDPTTLGTARFHDERFIAKE